MGVTDTGCWLEGTMIDVVGVGMGVTDTGCWLEGTMIDVGGVGMGVGVAEMMEFDGHASSISCTTVPAVAVKANCNCS